VEQPKKRENGPPEGESKDDQGEKKGEPASPVTSGEKEKKDKGRNAKVRGKRNTSWACTLSRRKRVVRKGPKRTKKKKVPAVVYPRGKSCLDLLKKLYYYGGRGGGGKAKSAEKRKRIELGFPGKKKKRKSSSTIAEKRHPAHRKGKGTLAKNLILWGGKPAFPQRTTTIHPGKKKKKKKNTAVVGKKKACFLGEETALAGPAKEHSLPTKGGKIKSGKCGETSTKGKKSCPTPVAEKGNNWVASKKKKRKM